MEMFSSFFHALKSFISEMAIEGSKDLKTVELGGYRVLVTLIAEANLDLVIITDREDTNKILHKIVPEIITIIINHKELFIEKKIKSSQLRTFNQDLSQFIISNGKIINQTMGETKNDFLETIWSFKGDLAKQIKNELIKERGTLISCLKTELYPEKLAFLEKIIDISEELKDDDNLIEYQKEANILKNEIKDRKMKLSYYMKQITNSINNLRGNEFKDIYLNLYSFCTKLKNMTKPEIIEKYQKIAKDLIDKNKFSKSEISKKLDELKKMSNNIDDYI